MNRQRLTAILIAIASSGWIVPLWGAVDAYQAYWQFEAFPLTNNRYPLTSFPHLPFATMLLHIAILWIGAVVAVWTYLGALILIRNLRGL